MKLSLYLLKLVGVRIAMSLAVMVGILQIIDLLDVTTDILDRGQGALGVLYYAMLRLPRLAEQSAPLAVLAGALFAFAKLAQESAVTAMRSTGVSAYRITMLALPAALVIAMGQLAIGQVVAPRTDEMLTDWWRGHTPKTTKDQPARPKDLITFRLGEEIVVARVTDSDGRRLGDVTIYHRDPVGRLTQRTTAEAAYFDGRAWQLVAPKFDMLTPASVRSGAATSMSWVQSLRPEDVQALVIGQPQITPSDARRALEGGVSVRPRTFYDTQVQRAWAGPAACLVMLLLAAPAAMANFRGGGATLLVQCLGSGLLFLVVDGAFTALGESGAAPAVFAAWAAPAMFAALGVTALLYLEG